MSFTISNVVDTPLDVEMEEGQTCNQEALSSKRFPLYLSINLMRRICTYLSGKGLKPNAVLKSYETNDITYEFTATTFRKTLRLPFDDPYPNSTPFIWFRPW